MMRQSERADRPASDTQTGDRVDTWSLGWREPVCRLAIGEAGLSIFDSINWRLLYQQSRSHNWRLGAKHWKVRTNLCIGCRNNSQILWIARVANIDSIRIILECVDPAYVRLTLQIYYPVWLREKARVISQFRAANARMFCFYGSELKIEIQLELRNSWWPQNIDFSQKMMRSLSRTLWRCRCHSYRGQCSFWAMIDGHFDRPGILCIPIARAATFANGRYLHYTN